jgi:hypothetical protein
MRKWLYLCLVSSLVTVPVAAQNRLQNDYVSFPGGELKAEPIVPRRASN